MSTGQSRRALVVASTLAMTLGPFVACVQSETGTSLDDAGDSPDAFILPEGSAEDAAEEVDVSDTSIGPDADTCSEGGFCPVPVPEQMALVAVAGTTMNDVWAIARDTILRWNGTEWKRVYEHVDPSPEFYGIWVAKPDDVWVLGTGVIVRYSSQNGRAPAFRKYTDAFHSSPQEVSGFWVNPATNELWLAADPWAQGVAGYRYREEPNGTLVEEPLISPPIAFPWTTSEETFFVRSVFGFASDDVYVGGDYCNTGECLWSLETDRSGAIAHYDGQTWSIVSTLDKGQRVSAIQGTIAPDQSRRLWIWAGIAGNPDNTVRLLPATKEGVVGSPLFTRTIRTDPGSYSHLDTYAKGCTRIFGSVVSPTEAWFSDVCFVYRWDGSAFEVVPTPINGMPIGKLMGLWAASGEEAWVVGEYPRRSAPNALPMGFSVRRTRSTP